MIFGYVVENDISNNIYKGRAQFSKYLRRTVGTNTLNSAYSCIAMYASILVAGRRLLLFINKSRMSLKAVCTTCICKAVKNICSYDS